MKRINVIGISGSGKSRLSDAVGARLGLPIVRLDALHHGPGWTEVPDAEFAAQVAGAADEDRWIMDGCYPGVRPTIWRRADTVIWTDLDKPLVMAQVAARSFSDWVTGRELFPGCRERLLNFLEPWHPIRWAWSNHAPFRMREETWLAEERWSHLKTIRLRSRREADAFMAAIGESGSGQ